MYDLVLGALSSLNQLTTISKALSDQKVAAAINSAVADIQSKLIQTQQQIMQVQADNEKLQQEIKAMKAQQELDGRVRFHDGAYWKKNDDATEDGPFCPSCWGLDKKLVLPSVDEVYSSSTSLRCTHHGREPVYFSVPNNLAKHLNP
jgi:hypothetical protein